MMAHTILMFFVFIALSKGQQQELQHHHQQQQQQQQHQQQQSDNELQALEAMVISDQDRQLKVTLHESHDCQAFSKVPAYIKDNVNTQGECFRNTCNDGCCRVFSWLVCDTTNAYPHLPCVCNQNTFLSTPEPTMTPTITVKPSSVPSALPTSTPSARPTQTSSAFPSLSQSPSIAPSTNPSISPSSSPTQIPTTTPSAHASTSPTITSSSSPTISLSSSPTTVPSATPSRVPTSMPSIASSSSPSSQPTPSLWQTTFYDNDDPELNRIVDRLDQCTATPPNLQFVTQHEIYLYSQILLFNNGDEPWTEGYLQTMVQQRLLNSIHEGFLEKILTCDFEPETSSNNDNNSNNRDPYAMMEDPYNSNPTTSSSSKNNIAWAIQATTIQPDGPINSPASSSSSSNPNASCYPYRATSSNHYCWKFQTTYKIWSYTNDNQQRRLQQEWRRNLLEVSESISEYWITQLSTYWNDLADQPDIDVHLMLKLSNNNNDDDLDIQVDDLAILQITRDELEYTATPSMVPTNIPSALPSMSQVPSDSPTVDTSRQTDISGIQDGIDAENLNDNDNNLSSKFKSKDRPLSTIDLIILTIGMLVLGFVLLTISGYYYRRRHRRHQLRKNTYFMHEQQRRNYNDDNKKNCNQYNSYERKSETDDTMDAMKERMRPWGESILQAEIDSGDGSNKQNHIMYI